MPRVSQNLVRVLSAMVGLALAATVSVANADDGLQVVAPLSHQVIQRQGFRPAEAHVHAAGGPALGFGDVPVVLRSEAPLKELAWRIGPAGQKAEGEWSKATLTTDDKKQARAVLRMPAGWHRLELKLGEEVRVVEPVGVGEVFLVAGQSYAEGANDELLKVQDPAGRVVALNPTALTWAVAHDPQPERGTGGTLWPSLGDLLVRVIQVPVAFVNVASGGTSSRQWLPGTPLYERLSTAGKQVGKFRAVLWQQGESDVIEKVLTETYVQNLRTIRDQLAKDWGTEAVWLTAKSTLHPTVYNDTEGEGRIRRAIDLLQQLPGFRPGPDTDVLGGDNRGGLGTRRHFSGVGQRNAALLWFAAVLHELNANAPEEPAPMRIERLPSGIRFAIWGDKPAKPAPTVVVFASTLESMATIPVYSDVGRHLAKQGWLTVALDPPCHGENVKEGEPPQLNGWPVRLEKGDDLVAPFVVRVQELLAHLVKEGYSDETRLAVCGTSRGGFLALHVGAAEPRFKAVVAFAPVTNLLALSEFKGKEQLKLAKDLSVINVADKLAGRPVWMIIGNHDERVSTDDALAVVRALAVAGAKIRKNPGVPLPVECIIAASAGHGLPPNVHLPAAEFILKHVPAAP